MDFYTKFGRRSDAYTGTLLNIMKRSNLVVRKFAYVTKLLMNHNEVVGVKYERHGKVFSAFASKEVVLSAGTIQTPRILMLSGIGPKKDLEELEVSLSN